MSNATHNLNDSVDDSLNEKVNEIAANFQRHEILTCQSSLVEELLKRDVFSIDDIKNEFPDVSNWSQTECETWCKDYGVNLNDITDGGKHPLELEDLRNLVQENIEPQEIFEWWLVTDWLAEHLIAIGEPVLENDYGFWWGRTCSGQSILQDGTLQQIVKKLGLHE